MLGVRQFLLVDIFALLVLSACTLITASPDLRSCVPRETDVPGWELLPHTLTHSKPLDVKDPPPGLLEKIAVSYRSLNNPRLAITIDMQKFNSPLSAYGQFSLERGFSANLRNATSQDAHFDSYMSTRGLFMRFAHYYIALSTDNKDYSNLDALKHFSAIILGQMRHVPADFSFPDYIRLFVFNPDISRSRNHLVFFANNNQDIPGLSRFFISQQRLLNIDAIIFFKDCRTPYKALHFYKKIIQNNSRHFIVTKSEDLEMAIKKNNSVYACISQHSNFVFGVFNASSIESGKILINLIYKKIR